MGPNPNNWKQGGIASSFLTAACAILGILSGGGQIAGVTIGGLSNALAQQWNPTASGGGLQLLSQYFYGVPPPLGSYASGSLTLVNSGGGVYSYGAGQAQFASTIPNAVGVYPTYTNESAFTLNALSTLSIEIECTFSGSGGNAIPGAISNLVTSMLGVTCSNPNPVLGSDPLSDPALRQYNISSLSRNSNYGPRSSYSYAIQTATNIVTGSPVNINRWTISVNSHTGVATIYICSPEGTTDPNDQAGIAACIESGAGSTDPTFTGARPPGATVGPDTVIIGSSTIGAPAPAVTVTYSPTSISVYVLAPKGTIANGTTPAGAPLSLQTTILNQLDNFFESQANPIGGLSFSDDNNLSFNGISESAVIGQIGQAIASVPGCSLIATRFVGPSDLTLLASEVAVNGISASTLNVIVTYTGN